MDRRAVPVFVAMVGGLGMILAGVAALLIVRGCLALPDVPHEPDGDRAPVPPVAPTGK